MGLISDVWYNNNWGFLPLKIMDASVLGWLSGGLLTDVYCNRGVWTKCFTDIITYPCSAPFPFFVAFMLRNASGPLCPRPNIGLARIHRTRVQQLPAFAPLMLHIHASPALFTPVFGPYFNPSSAALLVLVEGFRIEAALFADAGRTFGPVAPFAPLTVHRAVINGHLLSVFVLMLDLFVRTKSNVVLLSLAFSAPVFGLLNFMPAAVLSAYAGGAAGNAARAPRTPMGPFAVSYNIQIDPQWDAGQV